MTVHRSAPGSALIGLVIAILIFSVLAAAIVPMIGSVGQQTSASNRASKAYLLAESAFRHAASRYLHAGDSDRLRNAALDAVEGNYTLSDGNSRFVIDIYSYYGETAQDIPQGATSFTLHVPGKFPDGNLLAGGVFLDPGLQIQMEDQIHTLSIGSQPIAGQDDDITIAVDTPMPFYPAGTIALPIADADPVRSPSVSNGDDIAYQPGHGRMFPLRNGRILINGRLLTYAFNDRANNAFVDVRDLDDDTMVGHPIPSGTKIILTPFVRLLATGIYGKGAEQAARQVTYHTPLPLSEATVQQEVFEDKFDAKDDWSDTTGTSTSAGDVAGNSALRIEATAASGSDQGSLTAFSPESEAAKAIDFNAASRGGRGFLGYDIQIKVGFEGTPVPSFGFTPPASSVPTYVAAGLNFRLGDLPDSGATIFNTNTYGLSFLRGNSSAADGIPDDLVPIDDRPAIVLWQQTGNGADRSWLAYTEMTDLTLNEDNEDAGNDQFSKVGAPSLWDPQGSTGRQRGASTRNWYYGNGSTLTYNTGAANSGAIQSSLLSLPTGYDRITLKFWGWHETEPQRAGFALNDFDRKEVHILDDGGTSLSTFVIGTAAAPGDWYQEEIDLTPFAGQSIAIQFRFDTVDNLNNDYEGWYIDDVRIESEWPIQNITLAVGLEEAVVVRFADGFPEIREGDRIYGNSRRTIGRVSAPPLLTAGDWTDASRAQGVLLLDRVSVSHPVEAFDSGEQIIAIGGTGRARVTIYDETSDRKANIIRAYIATENGIGTPNTNPLDFNVGPYPRMEAGDTLHWPPWVDARGNWTDHDGSFTAAEDFFRLIQWDVLNAGAVSIPFRSAVQGLIPNAVIQTHEDDLQTLDFPAILSQDEIGLHTFGDGSLSTYFDDFGVRITVPQNNTLPAPVQQ
jgi:type II secretory pathway pseudopilin PulG